MYGNPYYTPPRQTGNMFGTQLNQPTYPMPIQPTPTNSLLGKVVDSMDVVKVAEYPLDGSVSYFPLADGSAIVSKQLQIDGTSKTTVYKPVEEKATPKYATVDEVEEIKKQLEEINNKIKEA